MKVVLQACHANHPAAQPDTPSALRDINVAVGSGEHVAIIGPSGAGKTTLLQVMACALQPSAGT
ncbi:MAG: ATP-binding cassette domain-containing protein, partial [Burkholderiaceae bacterium]